jgi:hypothetical protein
MTDKIIQTGIGLPVETLARLDRLRACFGRSRSHVVEYCLANDGLSGVEDDLRTDIEAYNAIAQALGITWQQLTERYVEEFGAKTYPPTVAALREMWAQEGMAPATAPAPRSLRDLRASSR